MAEQLQGSPNGGKSQQAKPQPPNTGQNGQTPQISPAAIRETDNQRRAINQAKNGGMMRQFGQLKIDFTELLPQAQDLKNNYQLDGKGQASVQRKIARIQRSLKEVTDILARLKGDDQTAIAEANRPNLEESVTGMKFKKKETLQEQQKCYRKIFGVTRDHMERQKLKYKRNVQINIGNNGGGQPQIGAQVVQSGQQQQQPQAAAPQVQSQGQQPQQVNGANAQQKAPQGGSGGQGGQGQPPNQQLAMYGDFGDYYADNVDVGGKNGIGDYGYGHRYIDGYDNYNHVNGHYVQGIGGSGVDNSMQFVYVTLIAMCIAVCMCCVCSLCGGIGAVVGYWMNNVMEVMERDNDKKVNYAIVNENGDESEV